MGIVTTHTEGRVVTHSGEGLPVEVVQLPSRDADVQAAAPPVAPAPAPAPPPKATPATPTKPTPAVKAAKKQQTARVRKATKAR